MCVKIIISIIFLMLAGCCQLFGDKREIRKYKEFDYRGYYCLNIKPQETVTLTFDILEVDDYVEWEIDEKPTDDIKLFDPNGKSHRYKRTCDSQEGLEWVLLFQIPDPAPGKWKMILTSSSTPADFCYVMYAGSNTEKAYK